MRTTVTHKKVKIIGEKQFLDVNTNEIENFQVVELQDADFNFNKIWVTNVIQALELVGNAKTKLLFWLIENKDCNNKVTYTYEQIAKQTKISLKTVRITMKALVDCNFMVRHHAGCYIINPDCVFKGSYKNRMNILLKYSKTLEENKKEEVPEPKPLTPNEKLQKYLSQSQNSFEDKLNLEEMLELQEKLTKMIELKLKDNANLSA